MPTPKPIAIEKTNGHRAKRDYSDKEKASALAALDFNGGNLKYTAQQLGISERTLGWWAGRYKKKQSDEAPQAGGSNPDILVQKQEIKESLADRLELLAHKYIDRLEKLEKVTAIDMAVVVDKMLLLRGQATNISKDVSAMKLEERQGRILELVEKSKVWSQE